MTKPCKYPHGFREGIPQVNDSNGLRPDRTVVRTTLAAVNCPFCLKASKTSKEHLFSKPICNVLGIDRAMDVASYDKNSGELGPIVPLKQRSVRLPCEECNSGWMSDLEIQTASTIRRWMSKPQNPLGRSGYENMMRWLVKMAVVFGFAEGGSRQFMETPIDVAVPDITRAKAIRNGVVPDHVRGGAAKVDASRLCGAPATRQSHQQAQTCSTHGQ